MTTTRKSGAHIIITGDLAKVAGEIAAQHPDCAIQIEWREGYGEREWHITATNGVEDWNYLADDEDGTYREEAA